MNSLIDYLYAAYHSKYGVCIETDNVERLRQKLYPLKKDNPDFDNLALVVSPLNGIDLWIVKQPEETVNAEE
jgi:hypothetical protein